MSLLQKLDQVVARHAELQASLSGGALDSQKFVAASKEYAELGPLVEAVNAWRKAEQDLKDTADEKNAILEIRAGTGGDEAALFAADLFRMYQRYAAEHKWKFEVMELSDTGIGGYREAIATVSGRGVFEIGRAHV